MSMLRSAPVIVLLALVATATWAESFRLGELQIERPYSPPTPPGAEVGAVYLEIDNHGATADRLVSASTPVAGKVEIHQMKMEGDVMRMRALNGVDVDAHGKVVFSPDNLHLMLTHLKHPLAPDEEFPVILQFERGGPVEIRVRVGRDDQR